MTPTQMPRTGRLISNEMAAVALVRENAAADAVDVDHPTGD